MRETECGACCGRIDQLCIASCRFLPMSYNRRQRRSTVMFSTLCILLAVTASEIETANSGLKSNRAAGRTPNRSSKPSTPIIHSSWRAAGDEYDRGFRSGSWNRFGHGFGKRDNDDGNDDRQWPAMTVTVDERFVSYDDGDAGIDRRRNVDDQSAKTASASNKE